jgi:uncharacterized alkaline shock family protein YloU
MFKIIHKTVGAILFLVAVFFSIMLFAQAVRSNASWMAFLGSYGIRQFEVGSLCAALFLGCVLFIITGLPRRLPDRFMKFPADGGALRVSVRGITSFVSKLADEFEGVTSVGASISPKPNQMDVRLDVKVRDGIQIHEMSDRLRARVRQGLNETLGITNVRDIIVNVKHISTHRRQTWGAGS